MNNFVQRTLSGVVFVSLIVGSILWNQYSFGVLFAFITVLATLEFHKLTNQQPQVKVNSVFAAIASLILFSALFFSLPILFTLYALFIVFTFIAELYRKKENPIHNLAYFVLGQVYIALPFSLLNSIYTSYQPLVLLAVFIIIWVNDTGAYLTGMTFGKHRLFERISPKKSWEGFFGGAVFAGIAGFVFSRFIPELSLLQWIIFAEIVVIFGTFGDLTESLMKRTLQVKDSGNLIPGHGGILDRFDSMILAVPAVYIFLQIISYLTSI